MTVQHGILTRMLLTSQHQSAPLQLWSLYYVVCKEWLLRAGEITVCQLEDLTASISLDFPNLAPRVARK